MSRPRTTKMGIVLTFMIIALALSCQASPQITSVNFTNPLGIGQPQTITASIVSNNSIISVDIELSGTNHSMNLNGGKYEYTWTPSIGIVSFAIYAMDNETNTATHMGSFEVKDLTPPSITSKEPSGEITEENVELKLTTSEDADCKYDTSNKTYVQMGNFFATTGLTSHSYLLTHIPSGEHIYYVACKDVDNNLVYDAVSFNANLPPSAKIVLSESSPLKSDTYKVKVISSKPLSTVPTLQYKYDDSSSYQDISLTGEDDYWTGYLVITDSSKDRIAKFYFKGTDYYGLIGSKITSGEMFVVDTTKPPEPTSIDASIDGDEIDVEWFYDGEEIDYFNIYRSTEAGVEYVDYYDKEDDEQFTDIDVDDGVKYFYRIAAIDKAGNVGDLSSEVSILYESEDDKEEEKDEEVEQSRLSSSLEKRLNKTYNEVKTLIFDAEFARSNLEKETDKYKSEIIRELKLVEKQNTAKNNLQNALHELDLIRQTDLSDSEFEDRISNVEKKIVKVKDDTVSNVLVLDTLEFTSSFSETEMNSIINEIFLNMDIKDELRENYTKEAYKLQETLTAYSKVIIAKLTYMNEGEKYTTYIGKEIINSKDAFDVILVEKIPKSFAESSKDLLFSTSPKVLKDDPIVYWSSSKFQGSKFSYYTNKKRLLSDSKDVVSVLLPDPSKFGPKVGVYSNSSDNGITGNAVINNKGERSIKDYVFLSIGILVIAGLVVYYLFFIKEPDESFNNIQRFDFQGQGSIPQMAEESSQDSLHGRHLKLLIEHANFHLDHKDFEGAKKEYELIYELYNSPDFSNNKEKMKLSNDIILIHKKISSKGDNEG